MSSKTDDTKKNIAKKFDLPERQSKIASILKQTDELYCICRSTDSTSFMIACDNCEEWYHGHCIGINESESKHIKRYYCDQCIAENPSLKIEFKKAKVPGGQQKDKSLASSSSGSSVGGGGAAGASGGTAQAKGGRRPGRPAAAPKDSFRPPQQPADKCLTQRNEKTVSLTPPSSPPPPSPTITTRRREQQHRTRRNDEDDIMMTYNRNPSGLRQCFAPVCQRAARPNSKYCSDECGVALASARLYLILPSRIEEWSLKKPVAEETNDREMIEVKKKQEDIQKITQELQAKRNALDDHIAKVETIKYDPKLEDDDEEEVEGLISCISCGKDVYSKDSIKHMEKCYNKFEGQMSFGSIYKTNVEGTPLFCDFLNPSTQTYCKRLQVLCCEHTKEPKIRDNEICGCPLESEHKIGEYKSFCRNAKKTCNKHYTWEKLRRGEIDMERIRMYLKMDELYEQERQILQAKHDRGGVMGLLLNSTFDHQLEEEIRQQEEYQRQLQAQQEQQQHEFETRHKFEQRQKEFHERRRAYHEQLDYEEHRRQEELYQQRQHQLNRDQQEEDEDEDEDDERRQQQQYERQEQKSKASSKTKSGTKRKKVISSSSSSSESVEEEGSGSEQTESEDEEEIVPSLTFNDDFVHLPSKREKARCKTVPATQAPTEKEMTASRLTRKDSS